MDYIVKRKAGSYIAIPAKVEIRDGVLHWQRDTRHIELGFFTWGAMERFLRSHAPEGEEVRFYEIEDATV